MGRRRSAPSTASAIAGSISWPGRDTTAGSTISTASPSLGIRTLRYPVLWERTAPRSLDDIDWRWSDERLARTCARSASGRSSGCCTTAAVPAYTSLLDDGFPEKLARFAGAVARRYPWVTDFTPVNEPLTTARFSGLYGHWYPHGRSDRDFVRALLNQLRGVVLAMRAIREVTPDARLIQTEDCGQTFGTHGDAPPGRARRAPALADVGPADRAGRRSASRCMAFLTRHGMTREDEAFFRTAECPPDVLGLNYYVTSDRYLDDRLRSLSADSAWRQRRDPLRRRRSRPGARRQGIVGHEAHLVAAWERYRHSGGDHRGASRMHARRAGAMADRKLGGAHAARARGADVRAVTAWALLGSYNWHSLVTRDDGHYEPGAFDVRAPAPRRTALGAVIHTLAHGGVAYAPGVDESWLVAPSGPTSALTAPAIASCGLWLCDTPAIVIVGARSMLGRAFARICSERGLVFHLADEEEMDLTRCAES